MKENSRNNKRRSVLELNRYYVNVHFFQEPSLGAISTLNTYTVLSVQSLKTYQRRYSCQHFCLYESWLSETLQAYNLSFLWLT